MNKKRKTLTIVALAVFGAIIFFHYCDPMFHQGEWRWTRADGVINSGHYKGEIRWHNGPPLIQNVQMPLFVLAVFYAGLFFISGERKPPRLKIQGVEDRRPMNENLRIALYVIAFILFVLLYKFVLTEEQKHPSQYEQETVYDPSDHY
jgi:hypothetical protein